MAKSKETILNLLGVNSQSDLTALLEAFNKYSVITDQEKSTVKQASVHSLPTVVKNDEKTVKERMYGIVTDEDKGAVALMNKRNVLLEQIILKLLEVLQTKEIKEFEGPLSTATEKTVEGTFDVVNSLINSLAQNVSGFISGSKIVAKAKADEDGTNIKSNYAKKTDIPTLMSELTNDKGFVSNTVKDLVNYYTKNDTYTKNEVLGLINQISTMSLQVVQELPTTDISSNVIYLIKTSNEEMNVYEEYIYINNTWELIGNTKVDLTGLVREEQVMDIVEENAEEVDTLDLEEVETLKIATSENYNSSSEEEIPTTKAVDKIISNKGFAKKDELFSKNYNDLSNKPTIPSKVSDLTNDTGYITETYVATSISNAITKVLNEEV